MLVKTKKTMSMPESGQLFLFWVNTSKWRSFSLAHFSQCLGLCQEYSPTVALSSILLPLVWERYSWRKTWLRLTWIIQRTVWKLYVWSHDSLSQSDIDPTSLKITDLSLGRLFGWDSCWITSLCRSEMMISKFNVICLRARIKTCLHMENK